MPAIILIQSHTPLVSGQIFNYKLFIMKIIFRNSVISMAAFVILAMLSFGCKKFLDKKQDAKAVVPTTLYDIQKLLDNSGLINIFHTPSYGEMSADDYYMSDASYDLVASALGEAQLHYYKWEKFFNENGSNDWGVGYQPVYYSNLALDVLHKIPRNQTNSALWDQVKGSALFYRSYYFLLLLWNYAKAYDATTAGKDFGIVLRQTSDFNVPSVRVTNEESYQRVIGDTKEAIRLLPDYPQIAYRPSKAAAYGLLARCYFSMRDYSRALLYADSSLQLTDALMNFNGDDDLQDGRAHFKQFNKETIFYTDMNKVGLIFNTSVGVSGIDSNLIKMYDSTDLRRQLFFDQPKEYYVFTGSYSSIINRLFSGIATDEMYLIRGECYVRQGQTEKGLGDLNKLLMNRYAAGTFSLYTGLVKEDAINLFLQERRKELVMRGLRWMDIKRLNAEGRGIVLQRYVHGQYYELLPNSPYYALPIPEDIIRLTGMPQN